MKDQSKVCFLKTIYGPDHREHYRIKFKSCKITPSPIKESPENARTLNTLPFSWQIYFPAKYVMKNFSPFVTGIIVETPALVEANVQTNVTLKN